MHSGDTTALLEREGELGQIALALDEARAGRGRLVLVEGQAGIGKTRLLEAARARAREAGTKVLAARASELDRDFPLGVVRQLFEPLLATADPARRAELLGGAAGPAGSLLDVAGATGHDPPADPGALDPSLSHFHALYWLTANLAEATPVALVIDDLHWSDATSLGFLRFLLPRIDELPVLVVLATRPVEPGFDRGPLDALATDPLTRTLHPAPLSEDAVATLIESALGKKPDAGFTNACGEATGGNPFLLRELLRELATDGVAPTAESVPVVRQLAPPTVARAVLLRLARLGEEASALARAVAVLGDGAPLRRAAALAGLDGEQAGELTGALASAGILAAARPLAFAHPILRAAVLADIDAGERAGAHRRAAELLAGEGAGADELAVHLLATEPAGDPGVVATLRDAADLARASGAAAVGVACLRRALAEPPPVEQRGPLLLELAAAELQAGEPAPAVEHFEEGLNVTSDPRARAATAWQHALALQALGRGEEAFALRERAAEEVAGVDRELALVVEASLVASASLDLSRLAWARERIERHRGRLAGASAAEQRLLMTQTYLDAMYSDAPAEGLADAAESALASGGLVDENGVMSTAFFSAVEVLWMADRVQPAREALDRALEEARRRGSALGFACFSGWRSLLLARLGELSDAEADARSCIEQSLPHGWFALAPPMLGYVLSVLVDRGELDDAERLLEQTGTATRPPGDDLTYFPLLHARGRLRAARGYVDAARADFAAVGAVEARWNTDLTLVPALLAAPELGAGGAEEARTDADHMLHGARTWGTARALGMALRAAGLAEGGERGIEQLREAAAALEGSPARLEHARALADLGAALRRAGSRAAARNPLRQALDLADACGAPPLAERVRHELRAAGGRPRRPRISGLEALTASERRIATMAAQGRSNPEIAQALFVTKKTVESHLGSAYRKLDIGSRAQLPAALNPGDAQPYR